MKRFHKKTGWKNALANSVLLIGCTDLTENCDLIEVQRFNDFFFRIDHGNLGQSTMQDYLWKHCPSWYHWLYALRRKERKRFLQCKYQFDIYFEQCITLGQYDLKWTACVILSSFPAMGQCVYMLAARASTTKLPDMLGKEIQIILRLF